MDVLRHKLDPAHFLSAPGLAWQACLKKTGVKLELLTDYNMLMMIEKGIRGGMCHAIHKYVKANNKYMKIVIKTLTHYILCIQTRIIYMDGQCHKNCL